MAISDAQIRAVLAANPNASDERIAEALIKNKAFGVTPARLAQVTGRDISGIRMSYGAQGGYSDQDINKVLSQRFLESGPLSAEEVNRAAVNYGISPEQMGRINPNLMEQTAGLKPAMETLSNVGDTLRTDLGTIQGTTEGLYDEAQDYQAPYREYGQEAAQRQAALTGALGPEAQQAAFAEYQQSPALDFLQSQSERALTRNAAAMGGIGGGNVRQDLNKLTAELYSQDFQNQFNRLGDIATRGYGASGTSAQLGGQQAGLMAQTALPVYRDIAQLGSQGAGYQYGIGRDMSQNIGQTAINMANAQTGNAAVQGGILDNLSAEQLSFYNQLAGAFGTNFANQSLGLANANQTMGANLSGVPGQTFTPVQGYDIGGAIDAAGKAYDQGNIMFPGQQPQYIPKGNMVMQSSANPAGLSGNLNLSPGVRTSDILQF